MRLALCFDLLPDDWDVQCCAAYGVQGHMRSGLAAAFENAILGQGAQRAVDGGAGATEFGGKVHLVWEGMTGGPIAGMDSAQHFALNGLPCVELVGHSASRRGVMASR